MSTNVRGNVRPGPASPAPGEPHSTTTWTLKSGLARMLKGGVIMDVVTAEQARIAEDAGAVAVMALERVPADIRADGGVARMSSCPVVVVHDTPATTGAPVVVGVDGSALSTNAIAYAYGQASSRGVSLTVVHGWWLENVEGTASSAQWSANWEKFAAEEQALVAESLAGWQEKYPDVEVRRHSVRGLPIEALVRQSENACLVVVGTRGRGGFAGLLLGSVSQGVMHRAHCPVAIVRGPRTASQSQTEQRISALPST